MSEYRTVITTLAGLLAIVALGWLAQGDKLPGDVVGALALAVAGVCGGQAAKSAVQHAAASKAGGITTEKLAASIRALARPTVQPGDGKR